MYQPCSSPMRTDTRIHEPFEPHGSMADTESQVLYTCIYIYINICAYVHIEIYTCIFVYICMKTHMCSSEPHGSMAETESQLETLDANSCNSSTWLQSKLLDVHLLLLLRTLLCEEKNLEPCW